MSIFAGPSVSSNTNLVFYYDMNNTKKSWISPPTTNLLGSNLIATTNTREITDGIYKGVYNGWEKIGITNDNPRTTLFNSTLGVSANTFYTFSCLYWSSDGNVDDIYLKFSDSGWTESSFYIQPISGQSTTRNGSWAVTSVGGNWWYAVGTFQTLATTTTLEQLFFDADTTGVTIFIANIQLEQGSIPSVFTSGTRSNTQAILDITGNNAITANNLTYSYNTGTFNGTSSYTITANGTSYNNNIREFSFNGSSSYMTVPMANLRPTSGITQEVWFNLTSTANDQVFIGSQYGTGTGNSYAIWSNGNQWLGGVNTTGAFSFLTATVTKNAATWYHFVYTYNGSVEKLYINGVEVATGPRTGNIVYDTNNTLLVLGGDWNGTGYNAGLTALVNGRMPLVKLYNAGLTANQVYQNYNATRGRFGL